MAEQYERFKRFEYRMNSNLVIQRDAPGPRQNESTGEPESLVGRINYKMGDKVTHESIKDKIGIKRKVQSVNDESTLRRRTNLDVNKDDSVLSLDISVGGGYVPSSQYTRSKYEELLNILQQTLGDQPQEVLKGAFEEIIQQLKLPNVKAEERKAGCEEVLGPISDDVYYRLYHTSKELVDYTLPGESNMGFDVDDTTGVAVVFDEDEDGDSEVGVEEEYEMDIPTESHAQPIRQSNVQDEEELETDQYHLPISRIDAHWLQRELNLIFGDPNIAVATEKEILSALKIPDVQECENRLVLILKYENFEFAKLVLRNRWKIMYCTRLGQAQTPEEKATIFEEMRNTPEGSEVLQELEVVNLRRSKEQELALNVKREAANLARRQAKTNRDEEDDDVIGEIDVEDSSTHGKTQPKVLDLEALTFKDGSQHMSNTKVTLPEGTERLEHKSYDEIIIKPLDRPKNLHRRAISTLPEWTHAAFQGIESLNPVQSAVSDVAFSEFEQNMLICAPTGAGKTNVALLAMLSVMARHLNEDGTLNLNDFKIVYVSPMKSLVMEQAQAFTQRFSSYGLVVKELTGDMSLTRKQLSETQLVVTTPEKWDVITRRSGLETSVELMIFDEIHLLHDRRGPVLEALIARTLHNDRRNRVKTRLVGLSATLPNYTDIAEFLRVDLSRGLFYFGNHYRPVGLEQRYIGIKEKKAIKRYNVMNEIVYERVVEEAGKNQMLIFVHSRKETARTAKLIRDTALLNDGLNVFLHKDSASREILATEAEAIKTSELKELLPYGFGIHHAGLPRSDRKLIEDLFADGHIKLLVSTATLSWGVNLPAHTVIIKGTQVYSPEEGCWTELCPLSVQQMMGRAGRPQYDKEGKGIIITSHDKLQFYLSLNNQQLPIESQLVNNLPELINAEIVLGNVNNRDDVVTWLKDTYLYVRMKKSPYVYGLSEGSGEDEFKERLESLAHSALIELEKYSLIRYERKSGSIQSTGMGRIASLFYLKPKSVKIYADNLRPGLSDSDVLRVFSSSVEFQYIPVREEEKVELSTLIEKVPIPIRGSGQDGSSKISILLQSYISRFELEGYALVSEMAFITQNAGRIMRALYVICLKRGWSQLAQKLFDLCKMVERRMWNVMLPLRQFKSLPEELILKLERKDFPWDRYYDLTSVELGELCRQPKLGKSLHRLVHLVPKLELQVFVQPLTRTRLSVEVIITPDFQWDYKIHGTSEHFWLFVEDGSGEEIYHSQTFVLHPFTNDQIQEHSLFFTLPISELLCYNYFLRVHSERWIGSCAKVSIGFSKLILPDKPHPHCELLDLQPLPISALSNTGNVPNLGKEFFTVKFGKGHFNAVQTQVYNCFYSSSGSTLLCAPYKSGKFLCAEIAIAKCLATCGADATIVVLCIFPSIAEMRFERLKRRFGDVCTIEYLCGDLKRDLKSVTESSIVVSIPRHWDFLSRRWKSKKALQSIDLFVVENLELLNDATVGPEMEICVSRMRFIAAQMEYNTRIVGLSIPMSNALDVGSWIGASSNSIFSFAPSVRDSPLVVSIQPFDQWDKESRCFSMFNMICHTCNGNIRKGIQTMVFTTDRRYCRLIAMELFITLSSVDLDDVVDLNDVNVIKSWNILSDDEIDVLRRLILREKALGQLLGVGIGYCHEGYTVEEIRMIEVLFKKNKLNVLVHTSPLAWNLTITCPTVIVVDVATFNVNRPVAHGHYPQADLLRIISHAQGNATAVIMLEFCQREHYKKLLYEAQPVESALESRLEELINAEIVQGAIESAQDAIDWLTWTLYYRRLLKNPNYYSLQGTSGQHLSEHLSEIVENTFTNLEKAQCITVEEDAVSPLNLGFISAFYCLRCATIEMFAKSVTEKANKENLLQILSYAEEFNDINLRLGEKIYNQKFDDINTKVKLLIKAHMERLPLSNDLIGDQCIILKKIIPLMYALIDVISSNGWLSPALVTMYLCQHIVQAMNINESPLKQLPNCTQDFINRAKGFGVSDLFDLIGMEDDDRDRLLESFTKAQVVDIAAVCNAIKVLDVKYDEKIECNANELISVNVNIELEGENTSVSAPYFPLERQEQWWVLLGDMGANKLYGIKRVSLPQSLNSVRLDFESPSQLGHYSLTLYIVSDSYVGTDHQYNIELVVN